MEEAANSKVLNQECAWPKGIQEGFKEGEGAEQERRPEGREWVGRSEKASGWGRTGALPPGNWEPGEGSEPRRGGL